MEAAAAHLGACLKNKPGMYGAGSCCSSSTARTTLFQVLTAARTRNSPALKGFQHTRGTGRIWACSRKPIHEENFVEVKHPESVMNVVSSKTAQVWWERTSRLAGVFLSATGLFLVSGLAIHDHVKAQVDTSAPKTMKADVDTSAAAAASAPKTMFSRKRTKVSSRAKRAKEQELKLQAVMKKLEEEPENVVAYKALLELRMQNGEMGEAIQVLDKLITMQPERLELKYMRARAYDFIGDIKKSRDEFQKLVEIQPFSAKALQGLALSMQKSGEDKSKILQLIQDAIRNATEQNQTVASRDLRMLLGQVLTIQVDPKLRSCCRAHGKLIETVKQNKFTEALVQYEELIKEEPNDFRPYLCEGLVYESLGKKDEATKYYDMYSKLCPKSFPNRKYLDELMLRGKFRAQQKEEAPVTDMQQPNPFSYEGKGAK